jgi:hypothetical protein
MPRIKELLKVKVTYDCTRTIAGKVSLSVTPLGLGRSGQGKLMAWSAAFTQPRAGL